MRPAPSAEPSCRPKSQAGLHQPLHTASARSTAPTKLLLQRRQLHTPIQPQAQKPCLFVLPLRREPRGLHRLAARAR